MDEVHASVIIGVLALGALYVVTGWGMGRRVVPRQAAAFAGGLVTILVALNGLQASPAIFGFRG